MHAVIQGSRLFLFEHDAHYTRLLFLISILPVLWHGWNIWENRNQTFKLDGEPQPGRLMLQSDMITA